MARACAMGSARGRLALIFTAFAVAMPAAFAQTPEQIAIVAGEIVPEHLRPLALTDQEAMIDQWVAGEMALILEQMVARGAVREVAAGSLAEAEASFRDLIETDWYGRVDSFPNRDPRFAGLTDRDLLDRAAEAEDADDVCAQADHLAEFYHRNTRARADRLPDVEALQQACGR